MSTKLIVTVIVVIVVVVAAGFMLFSGNTEEAPADELQAGEPVGQNQETDSSVEDKGAPADSAKTTKPASTGFVDCGTAGELGSLQGNVDFATFPASAKEAYACMKNTLESCTPSRVVQLGSELAGQGGLKTPDYTYEVLGKEGNLCMMNLPLGTGSNVETKKCGFSDGVVSAFYQLTDSENPTAGDHAKSFSVIFTLGMLLFSQEQEGTTSTDLPLPGGSTAKFECK